MSIFFFMVNYDLNETYNIKVVDLHELYNFYSHNFFQKFLDLKL